MALKASHDLLAHAAGRDRAKGPSPKARSRAGRPETWPDGRKPITKRIANRWQTHPQPWSQTHRNQIAPGPVRSSRSIRRKTPSRGGVGA